MKSFVQALQDEIVRLKAENAELKIHAPYGIYTRAALEIEKRSVSERAEYVVFGDIDDMHGLNTQYGYEEVNARIRNALQVRSSDLLLAGLWFSGDEIVFVVRGDVLGFINRVQLAFAKQGMGITLAYAKITDFENIDAAIQASAETVQRLKAERKAGR